MSTENYGEFLLRTTKRTDPSYINFVTPKDPQTAITRLMTHTKIQETCKEFPSEATKAACELNEIIYNDLITGGIHISSDGDMN